MAEIITAPSPFARQVSGGDPQGNYILSVLAKRSYRYDSRGVCAPHEEPAPLREIFTYDDTSGELLQESDIYPVKPGTDVVLHGQAGGAGPVRRLQCGLRIGGHEKRIAGIGNRAVSLAGGGELLFSEPAPFTAIALSYRNAYGGRDVAGHAAIGNPLTHLTEYTKREFGLDQFSLCDYPRNPAGKGYLCHWDPASLEALELPNLEDPADLLTPSRFFAGNWDRWPAMPMPQGMGWLAHNWFPRIAYLGFAPRHDPAYAATPEAARGLIPANLMTDRRATEPVNFRFMQGASLGLQLPPLRGDELIELANILPEPQTRIQLPGERPVIHVDGRNGKMAATAPVLHTIHIEPFFRRVSLVWRGSAPALRPYMEEELQAMPLSVRW
jgi:hypothetical protein